MTLLVNEINGSPRGWIRVSGELFKAEFLVWLTSARLVEIVGRLKTVRSVPSRAN